VQPEPPATERPDSDRDYRGRLERVLPELVRRWLETGLERLSEGPENVRQLVSDLRLPKEILGLLAENLDETKSGLYRAVAREIRDFLEHTSFADELARVLTTVSFEIKTEVRFIPNDSRLGAAPDVRAKIRVKRADEPARRPSRPPSQPPPPADLPSE